MTHESNAVSAQARAQDISAVETVKAFVSALERLELDTASAMVSDDMRWVNGGWKTAGNKKRFAKVLHAMFKDASRFEVQYFDIHERDDGVVYTDRIDIFEGGGLAMRLPVQGEFRVRDGLVTDWVDSFSWAKLLGDIGRSLPAIIKHRFGR